MMVETSSDSISTSQIYFADEPYESKEFGSQVFAFADSFVEWCEDTGLASRWIQNSCLYHGVDPQAVDSESGTWTEDAFEIVGKNGELLNANYNDARNLVQHVLAMTVAQPPNIIAKAINDEDASLVAAQTFDGLFSYYLTTYKSARLSKQSRISVEYALVEDIGWMLCEWDTTAGKPLDVKMRDADPDPMTGQPPINPVTGKIQQVEVTDERGQTQLEFEGDLYFKARSQWDVFWDPGCEDDDEIDWVLVRDQANKYEYAKRFPQHADRLLSAQMSISSNRLRQWRRGFQRAKKSNLIDVWKFYHRPTASMPKGRYALLLDPDTILEDGPNKYDRLPVFGIKAMEGLGTPIGYAPMNLIAPVQQSRNVLSSAMMTNFAMFGVQNVAVKDTDQYDVAEIAGGLNVLRYADTPPAPLQLAQQANGIDEHFDRLGTVGETLSGVNSVIRGDPEASLKSGKALGIVQAAGVQYNSPLAASYAQFLKDVGNFMLYCFRTFIKSQRVTQIVGENDKMQSVTWDKDTFGPIDRVEAELVDPAMRTLGYKTDLAMFLVQSKLVQTPQEFLTVLTSGQIKPLFRAQLTELNLIHCENREMTEAATKIRPQFDALNQAMQESVMRADLVSAQMAQQTLMQLVQSSVPPVHEDDDDDIHMAEHKSVSASPATRRDPLLMAIYDAHRNAHRENRIKKAAEQAQDTVALQAQTTAMAAQAGILPQAPAQQAPQQEAA